MAPHPFRPVVFDCDGTLVDSQHAIVAAVTEACRGLGLAEPSAAAIRRVVGPTLEQAIEPLFPDCDRGRLAETAARYRIAAQKLRPQESHREPLFPGVREALDGPAMAFGIATGKNRRGLLHTLAAHGLEHRFATLQTPDTCRGEPHPEMLERAMAETGTLPEETVFIGDTTFDMLMARDAGTAAVGAGWGYHAPDELIRRGRDRRSAGSPADSAGRAGKGRMKRLKKIAIGLAVLVVAVIVAIVAILLSVDYNQYKSVAIAEVEAATGRKFEIAGDLSLSLRLSPRIVLNDVTLANADWGTRPDMLKIRRLEVEVELLPLLSGDIWVKRLIVKGADILLERSPDGAVNWVFGTASSSEASSAATSSGPALPMINDVSIQDSQLRYRDGQTGEEHGLFIELAARFGKRIRRAGDACRRRSDR